MPLEQVQKKIIETLLNGESISRLRLEGGKARLLVGHRIEIDLKCLRICYPDHMLRDTAMYQPLMKTNVASHSLKYLTKNFLGSPSGQVSGRGTRRFDMMDSRERIENNEYFTGSIHSVRFHDVGSDGSAEGRIMCSESRRSFRAPYDSAEVEKFHFHVEWVPRPYRFSPEADSKFHERCNLRDRKFERRVKNQSGNAPRRTRSVEAHDENYWDGEEGWDGAAFVDVSPAKRKWDTRRAPHPNFLKR